jgi:hypothetical protein
MGSQLPRVGIDDLEFLLDADREGVLHAAAIIVREVAISLDRLIAFVAFAITFWCPPKGLLLVAMLAPLGHLVAMASGHSGSRPTDAMAAAFILGWLVRALPDRSGPRVAAPLAAWLLCALAAASFAGTGYEPESLAAATRFVLGLALTAATVKLFRQRPELAIDLPVAMAASASVAVLAPSLDAHAFVAYFALVACLTIGMAVRADGRARVAWTAVSAWLIVGLASAALRPPNVTSGFSRTWPLIAATLDVLASRPFFGLGIGLDETTTPLFYSPWLSWHGGALGSHNLLVIAAELGLVGLGLWCVWIGAGLLRAVRALAIDSRDARLWGATVGVAAYIAALAVSRPLARGETVYPFMLQFGLMTALAGSTLLDRTPPPTRPPRWRAAVTALAMAVIAAGALLSARRGPIEPPASQVVDGYASVAVPAGITRAQLPMRASTSSPVYVEIKVDGGKPQTRTVGSAWQTVSIALPESSTTGRFHRIDVRMPEAGVELGEIQF